MLSLKVLPVQVMRVHHVFLGSSKSEGFLEQLSRSPLVSEGTSARQRRAGPKQVGFLNPRVFKSISTSNLSKQSVEHLLLLLM